MRFPSCFPGEQLPAHQAAGRLLLLRGGPADRARRPRQVLRRARPQDDQGHQSGQEEEGLGEQACKLKFRLRELTSCLCSA